jgi:recombination protein RecR
LPGIGGKSAQRIAFHLLSIQDVDARRLGQAIFDLRDQVGHCRRCFNVTVSEECTICRDTAGTPLSCAWWNVRRTSSSWRGPRSIGALSRPRRVAFSRSTASDPISSGFPSCAAVDDEEFTELIVATNPTMEGDATAMYLAKEFKPRGLRVSRLASGLPVGGDLDYADELTLGRALVGRMEL